MARQVVVEADGASRGNPGPASYGAVLRDAETGEVIAEDARTLGVATNNVAEYSGLVAGLELAAARAPGAAVEVRMDSKLVIEQMSGNWKIKNADLAVLADRARAAHPGPVRYVWVPRERNRDADRLGNEVLDGKRPEGPSDAAPSAPEQNIETSTPASTPRRGWSGGGERPTTLVLVRHGVTAMTVDKRFSGGLGGANPPLSEEGRDQARQTGAWLRSLSEHVDEVLTSPVLRTMQTAEEISSVLGMRAEQAPAFAEMEFGRWDGLTFAEVAEQHGDDMHHWFSSLDAAPHGGESFRQVQQRVIAGLDELVTERAGRTLVLVSHVTPIKVLVAQALGAPLEAVYRMELSPASVTAVSYYPDTRPAPVRETSPAAGGGAGGVPPYLASLRLFNARPGPMPLAL
ncbi:bifunctional RNase H/acid phosphatase [Nocardioides daejeonensis]|uniref:bifunctional RNase H/acid phosphatase n=1 Tax=Nocardioides daejeonensis TaxID=1046556 RepID=UPI001EF48F45|nr:bifunctional RNase H/acid phosphatase [Nocardioides daejeonensis]